MYNIYQHIIPEMQNWPVTQLSTGRKEFVSELNEYVIKQILDNHQNGLQELISKTIYLENQRIKGIPWRVDPPDEKQYWSEISGLIEKAKTREDKLDAEIDVLRRIVNRYNEEILGNFIPKSFALSRILLTSFFKRIFNKYFDNGKWRWGKKIDLQKNIKVNGQIELVRNLFDKGTVVLVPTHYSNLDSIMIGYAIDANAGLPAFSYGAGLNLFNVEIVGYFINRLGAYKVDRRKKNPIYLECLKSMSAYSIFKGVNSLFFPGGTRSRNGAIEDKLKLGLIESTIEAQRLYLENEDNRKVFIVPLTLGYHFVLEAPQLIEQHLMSLGNDKFKRKRGSSPSIKTLWSFIKLLYTKKSEVYLNFGDPMDILGNKVNEQGISKDKSGQEVNLKDYFSLHGQMSSNAQREGVYARVLADNIINSYKKYNVILSSNIVAFIAFHLIYERSGASDLSTLLNKKDVSYDVSFGELKEKASLLVKKILELYAVGDVIISDEPWQDIDELCRVGISKLGVYHIESVLDLNRSNNLKCKDIRTLYYYHNRLVNYDFENLFGWKKL